MNEVRLVDATGLAVAVGTRDQIMSFLKHHSQDGEYAIAGPGIDARLYRVGGVIYPGGGQIDGQTIPPRSREECVAVFGPAIEINNGAQKDGDISRAEGRVLVVRGAKVSVDKLSFPVSVRVDLALGGDESLSVLIPAPLDSSWPHLAESICVKCGDLWDHCRCSHEDEDHEEEGGENDEYADEHPVEGRGPDVDRDTERLNQPVQDNPSPAGGSKGDILSDEEFLKELEAMSGPDEPTANEADPAVPKALLLDRLREAGVVSVSVEYDGSCDSGCVEDVTAIGIGGEAITLAADLRELVEEYVYERLPGGWEINDGSFGEVEIDVMAGTVTFDHHQRYTDEQPWEE
jgi:hypothetical protein